MPKPSREKKAVVGRVMHEFKEGRLESGAGGRIRSPRQAIAIALSEAGASNRTTPARTEARLRHTCAGGGSVEAPSRADLYAEAKRAGIPNRSKMSKAELERALRSPPRPGPG